MVKLTEIEQCPFESTDKKRTILINQLKLIRVTFVLSEPTAYQSRAFGSTSITGRSPEYALPGNRLKISLGNLENGLIIEAMYQFDKTGRSYAAGSSSIPMSRGGDMLFKLRGKGSWIPARTDQVFDGILNSDITLTIEKRNRLFRKLPSIVIVVKPTQKIMDTFLYELHIKVLDDEDKKVFL